MTLHVFVGYDLREHPAWLVCRDTLLNPIENGGFHLGGKLDVEVHPLAHKQLRRAGHFDRPWRIDEAGQTWDERDGRPFSTEFAHSRFLTPFLAKQMGVTRGPVVFVDCDFMFLRPITEMLHGINPDKVVSVVKHDFERVAEGVKMDGMAQQRYFRKLWSSLMVFNMGHPDIDLFNTPHASNFSTGSTLHGLRALEDHEIGEVTEAWNYVPGHSSSGVRPSAVHWSLGGPWMDDFRDAPFANLWRQRYRDVVTDALDHNLAATFPLV
jgi:hypothetical protein